MVTPVIVVLDEGCDLCFQITGQIIVFQQDAVLQGLVLTCPVLFVPSELIEIGLERSLDMAKKRPTPEQIVTLLRQIEVATSQGKSVSIACREAGISGQSYYRWRKEYGGLDLDQARRMKDLEKENGRLKRLVADLSLEKQVLKGKAVKQSIQWIDCRPNASGNL